MTIRIGTSERDGTFYSQGSALKTIFERQPELAPVELVEFEIRQHGKRWSPGGR